MDCLIVADALNFPAKADMLVIPISLDFSWLANEFQYAAFHKSF